MIVAVNKNDIDIIFADNMLLEYDLVILTVLETERKNNLGFARVWAQLCACFSWSRIFIEVQYFCRSPI